jgi:hypothetical protein
MAKQGFFAAEKLLEAVQNEETHLRQIRERDEAIQGLRQQVQEKEALADKCGESELQLAKAQAELAILRATSQRQLEMIQRIKKNEVEEEEANEYMRERLLLERRALVERLAWDLNSAAPAEEKLRRLRGTVAKMQDPQKSAEVLEKLIESRPELGVHLREAATMKAHVTCWQKKNAQSILLKEHQLQMTGHVSSAEADAMSYSHGAQLPPAPALGPAPSPRPAKRRRGDE